jgi:hypothetical protein
VRVESRVRVRQERRLAWESFIPIEKERASLTGF